MQKTLLTLFIITMLFSCGNNENSNEILVAPNSDWTTQHLIGHVKTIEETEYTPDEEGNIGEMDSCCIETEYFNDKGYRIKITSTDRNGTEGDITNIERIDGAKMKASTTTNNGSHIKSRTLYYDTDGNLSYAEDTDTSKKIIRVHSAMKLNDLGQALEGKTHDGDSTFLGSWTLEYHDNMNTGGSWSNADGIKLSETTAEMNDKGLESKSTATQASKNGSETTVSNFTYDSFDEMGNWTQCTETNADGKVVEVEKRTYTYYE